MTKARYRVGETANLDVFPHGTKVGSEIELTEAEALYECDMGRITPVEEKKDEAAPVALPAPPTIIADETDAFPAKTESAPLALKPGRAR